MNSLIWFNISFCLNGICSLFAWYKQDFQATYLSYLIFYISLNTLLCIFFNFIKSIIKNHVFLNHQTEFKSTISQVFFNLFTSIPIFFVAIQLFSVKFLPLSKVALHALLLSLLTVYPNYHGRYRYGLFGLRAEKQPSNQRDLFILVNFFLVTILSWLGSFFYCLDNKNPLSQYPVASCTLAIVGSLVANVGNILYQLFTQCNNLYVY